MLISFKIKLIMKVLLIVLIVSLASAFDAVSTVGAGSAILGALDFMWPTKVHLNTTEPILADPIETKAKVPETEA
jgi:hypothetical protein